MKYANTALCNGNETIVTILPLEFVPDFDPENPVQENTYAVPDEVQYGWVRNAEGDFIPPVARPPAVPQIVSRYQGFCALHQAGYLDEINTYMTSADPLEKLAWDTITEVRRDSPLLAKLGVVPLGLTETQIDDLFRFAATIEA